MPDFLIILFLWPSVMLTVYSKKWQIFKPICILIIFNHKSNHKKSINHNKCSKETTLSKRLWQLKEMEVNFELKWKILDRAQPFSPVSWVCGLCTLEKWYILFKPELSTLNRREEILGHCFHKVPALLKNSWTLPKIPRDQKILISYCHFSSPP